MRKKQFFKGGFVIFGLLFALFGSAQTVEHRPGSRRFPFDNSGFFKEHKPDGFWDWKDYGETLDGKSFALWGAMMGAGVAHGMREAYHANPYVFEQAWGVSNTSFWGSDAWKRNYVDNNPDKPHKSEHFGNVGRDIWHTANAVSKVLIISGTFGIGARTKQPTKFRALNLLIGVGAQSLFATLTYNTFRK